MLRAEMIPDGKREKEEQHLRCVLMGKAGSETQIGKRTSTYFLGQDKQGIADPLWAPSLLAPAPSCSGSTTALSPSSSERQPLSSPAFPEDRCLSLQKGCSQQCPGQHLLPPKKSSPWYNPCPEDFQPSGALAVDGVTAESERKLGNKWVSVGNKLSTRNRKRRVVTQVIAPSRDRIFAYQKYLVSKENISIWHISNGMGKQIICVHIYIQYIKRYAEFDISICQKRVTGEWGQEATEHRLDVRQI